MKNLIFGVFLLISTATSSQEDMSYGKKFTLDSDVLGESRTYWVHVPNSYHDSQLSKVLYPVIYVLDRTSGIRLNPIL